MRYSISHQTDTGSRETNQDRVAYSERDNSVLMIVADGLGGYEGGELAAQTLMDSILGFYENTKAEVINDPAAFIVLSISYAHTMINQRARTAGMDASQPRTTCVVCLVQNGFAYWGHVGDSRLYLMDDREVITRTIDHSTAELGHHDLGPEPDQMTDYDHAHLLRCVGGNKKPVVSLGPETHLNTGDTLLLCTDGVWRAFNDRQIFKYSTRDMVDDSIEKMISRAQRRFRKDCDNLSLLMFRWDDVPSHHPPLLNLSIPELDQESLWQEVRSQKQKQCGAKPLNNEKFDKSEIKSTIEEIESFVKNLDSWL